MMGRPNIVSARALAAHVASGIGEPSASIPVSSSGAAVGDLLLVFAPYSGGSLALGGTGWTTFTDTDAQGGAYISLVSWKVITSTADVTVGSGSFQGTAWSIWRGPTMLYRAAFATGASTITVPGPAGNCMGQLLIASDQVGNHAPATPTGYTSRANGATNGGSFFDMSIFSIADAFSGVATLTTAFWAGDTTSALYALELQR